MNGKKIDAYNVNTIRYSHNSTDQVLRHRHDDFEIVYYLEGKGTSTIYGNNIFSFNYNADCIVIIPPGLYHSEYAREETQVVCNLLELPVDRMDNALFYRKSAKNEHTFYKIRGYMLEISALWFEMHSKKVDNAAQINELLMHLTITVFSLIVKESRSGEHGGVELSAAVKDYIRRYAFKRIHYPILAEEFGYSYDRFRHIFSEETGMTLYAYQQAIRLDYAKRQLLTTNVRIGELALRCGYTNSIRFCEWFTGKVGMSPRKYRSLGNDFEWGVIMNANTVKQRNTLPVVLDVDTDAPPAGFSAVLAYVMHGKGYIDLSCTLFSGGRTQEEGTKELLSLYKREGLSAGEGEEALPLLMNKLSPTEGKRTLIFTGTLAHLAALLREEGGGALLRGGADTVIVLASAGRETEGRIPLRGVEELGALARALEEDGVSAFVLDVSAPVTIDGEGIGADVPLPARRGGAEPECNVMDLVALMYAVFAGGGMFARRDGLRLDAERGELVADEGGCVSLLRINTPSELREQMYALAVRISDLVAM